MNCFRRKLLKQFFVIPVSQVNTNACMIVFIWRLVITEMERSEIEVLPEGYRVGVSLLDSQRLLAQADYSLVALYEQAQHGY